MCKREIGEEREERERGTKSVSAMEVCGAMYKIYKRAYSMCAHAL